MSEVVKFGPKAPKDPMIWVCECGCSTFELLSDNTVRCPVCETVSPSPDGGWYAPDTDKTWEGKDPDEGPIRDISGNSSVEFARARLRKLASDDEAVGVCVFKADGSVHAWSMVETAEQLQWFREKLDIAYDITARKFVEEGQE